MKTKTIIVLLVLAVWLITLKLFGAPAPITAQEAKKIAKDAVVYHYKEFQVTVKNKI